MQKGGNRILTDFPKKGNRIDWKSTVGMEVELIYNDKLYVVKIVGYEYPVLKIEYNKTINQERRPHSGNIGRNGG